MANDMTGCIHGIRQGKAIRIPVYQKGRDVKLSGPNAPHWVDSSNTGSDAGWMREANTVWGVTDMFYVPSILFKDESTKEKIEALEARAARIAAKS